MRKIHIKTINTFSSFSVFTLQVPLLTTTTTTTNILTCRHCLTWKLSTYTCTHVQSLLWHINSSLPIYLVINSKTSCLNIVKCIWAQQTEELCSELVPLLKDAWPTHSKSGPPEILCNHCCLPNYTALHKPLQPNYHLIKYFWRNLALLLWKFIFKNNQQTTRCHFYQLTLILLTWRIRRANNASRWQMGFNSVFEGLKGHAACTHLDYWPCGPQ